MTNFEKKTTLELVEAVEKIAKELRSRFEITQTVPFDENSSRKEVIKIAKEYLDKLATKYKYHNDNETKKYLFKNWVTTLEFIVNEKKRTVTVLLKGRDTGKVRSVGVAKCDPKDVFNIHIGAAIALHRALKLPVPTILITAPNPTKVEIGDILGFADNSEVTEYEVTSLITNSFTPNLIVSKDFLGKDVRKQKMVAYGGNFSFARILDDSKYNN